ncbi:MAG: aldo/keto reductase [Proteobacteria bacterium]|uniref:Aldo/keto reductase n=1 Tax=Candidatus Avisuccinivibrio stercorigallinarum TaxID=2840704 RepID=A0A9D9DD37_9GAMM|nr:aldo/keto reductase [Candidatus Avisuccinivibrio stercorigallinarum]
MDYIQLPNTKLKASRLAMGCMRINRLTVNELERLINEALELGINFFDHADIYGRGECERLFGQVLQRTPSLRFKMILQDKCDIVPEWAGGKRFDTSRKHIIKSVLDSLSRLCTDHLDILLLHRADPLCDPQELAETFADLKREGLVRYFGVSNYRPQKISLLQRYCKDPLIINQVQLSVLHCPSIDAEVCFNVCGDDMAVDREGGLIDYCRLHDITLQPWCPLQGSAWREGTFIDNPKYARLNAVLGRIAAERGVSKAAVAIAWLLRHPARMQPILGTTSIEHLRENCKAVEVSLSRQEWLDLYTAEGKVMP